MLFFCYFFFFLFYFFFFFFVKSVWTRVLEFTKTVLAQNVKPLESGTKYPVKQRHIQEELIYIVVKI